MQLVVNGTPYDIETAPLATLLHVLREEVGVTSPKAGCQQGGCGACTVLVDGEPRRACLTPVGALDGAEVTTVEGLASGGMLSTVQSAFTQGYASQCGFCTPGFVIATTALLERSPDASREDVLEGLAGHVCRCTGYVKIVDAVLAAARGQVEPQPAFPESEVGQPEVRVEGSPA
jgi:aerobic carbon-monoxide dehydrogenase small subunit